MFKELFDRCTGKSLSEHEKFHALLDKNVKRMDEIRIKLSEYEKNIGDLALRIITDCSTKEDVQDVIDLYGEYRNIQMEYTLSYYPYNPLSDCYFLYKIFEKHGLL